MILPSHIKVFTVLAYSLSFLNYYGCVSFLVRAALEEKRKAAAALDSDEDGDDEDGEDD
jgi:hypothetical protein